jgi:hypothetical protein
MAKFLHAKLMSALIDLWARLLLQEHEELTVPLITLYW